MTYWQMVLHGVGILTCAACLWGLVCVSIRLAEHLEYAWRLSTQAATVLALGIIFLLLLFGVPAVVVWVR